MESYLGESIPKLGFGLMRLPQKGDEFDLEQIKAMTDLFMEAGFCYFDTSWGYTGSEEVFKAAVADRYSRESYILATKCPVWMVKTRDEAHRMLDTSLKRTNAGYIDYYLLHNMGEARTKFFDDFDMWDFAAKAKADKKVKHVGFSFHDKADALERLLCEHPEAEFVQLQINYADWENPVIEAKKCYETARRHNKPVIIMEPVKGGMLSTPPQTVLDIFSGVNAEASPASWAIRYTASLDGVITVLSGMSDLNQMKDNISFMRDFTPLSDKEQTAVRLAGEIISQSSIVPCTSCKYCMKVCPNSIAIPGIFEAVNVYGTFCDKPRSQHRYDWNTDGCSLNKASACIECGACEGVCPQHIAIRDELKKARGLFENA